MIATDKLVLASHSGGWSRGRRTRAATQKEEQFSQVLDLYDASAAKSEPASKNTSADGGKHLSGSTILAIHEMDKESA